MVVDGSEKRKQWPGRDGISGIMLDESDIEI